MSEDKYNGLLAPVVEAIEENKFNPSAIYHLSLNTLEQYTNGEVQILDASHPLPYALEWSSVNGAVTNSYIDTKTRQLYATLAQSEEDLNRHMSDHENYDRFATPVTTNFHLLLDKLSILNYAVSDPINNKLKKIIIPEDTRFKINDQYFGIHYPIVIRLLDNGNIKVMWDIDKQNPIAPLTSNDLNVVWRKQTPPDPSAQNVEILDIEIPVSQFKKERHSLPANQSTGFVNSFDFEDQYYLTRVFTGDDSSGWNELHTTYSYQVYNNDTKTPTALLQKLDNKIRVEIPQIFFNNGSIKNNVRVDIYTTKGYQSINFSDYDISLFSAEWLNTNITTKRYSEPLNKFALASIYSTDTARGGSNGMTYEETREMVINNNIKSDQAILPRQLSIELKKKGYELVTYKDYITENLYLATRALPNIQLDDVAISANCGIMILSASENELNALSTVIDNGSRFTVTPETLYHVVDGVVQYCTDSEKQQLEQLTPADRVNRLNGSDYIYSPFHYVYDNTLDYFNYRGYYLDSPKIQNKFFQDMNDTTDLQVSTKIVNLNKTSTGWKLLLQTISNSKVKTLGDHQLIPQISILGVNEINHAFKNASFIKRTADKEFVYECDIVSNHDINDKHELTIKDFKVNKSDPLNKTVKLHDTLNIIYTVNGYSGQLGNSPLDTKMNLDFIPLNSKGLTHETLDVDFGYFLDGLFSEQRSISGGLEFQKYQTDIIAKYPEDVWELNPDGTIKYVDNPNYDPHDPQSPPLLGNKLYSKGDDIILNGVPTYSHRAGDVILKNGEPIPINSRTTIHECQLFFLDAKFRYVTEKNSLQYVKTLPLSVLDYLNNDILPTQSKMLNLTTLQYYPRRAIGKVAVNISKNNTKVINATQSPVVNVYVTDVVYNDFDQRKLLSRTIKKVLINQINKMNVNIDSIYQEIKPKIEQDIISFNVEPLGDNHTLNRYTIVNQNENTNIGIKLELQTDGTLKLIDTCTINFFIAEEYNR